MSSRSIPPEAGQELRAHQTEEARALPAPAEVGTLAALPDVARVEEVATVLRCSKWCVYDLISSGQLKAIRLGRALRVTHRAVEEFLSLGGGR